MLCCRPCRLSEITRAKITCRNPICHEPRSCTGPCISSVCCCVSPAYLAVRSIALLPVVAFFGLVASGALPPSCASVPRPSTGNRCCMQRSLIRSLTATQSVTCPASGLFRRQVTAMTYSSFKFKVTGKVTLSRGPYCLANQFRSKLHSNDCFICCSAPREHAALQLVTETAKVGCRCKVCSSELAQLRKPRSLEWLAMLRMPLMVVSRVKPRASRSQYLK